MNSWISMDVFITYRKEILTNIQFLNTSYRTDILTDMMERAPAFLGNLTYFPNGINGSTAEIEAYAAHSMRELNNSDDLDQYLNMDNTCLPNFNENISESVLFSGSMSPTTSTQSRFVAQFQIH